MADDKNLVGMDAGEHPVFKGNKEEHVPYYLRNKTEVFTPEPKKEEKKDIVEPVIVVDSIEAIEVVKEITHETPVVVDKGIYREDKTSNRIVFGVSLTLVLLLVAFMIFAIVQIAINASK